MIVQSIGLLNSVCMISYIHSTLGSFASHIFFSFFYFIFFLYFYHRLLIFYYYFYFYLYFSPSFLWETIHSTLHCILGCTT